MILSVDGPLIVTASIEQQLALFADVFALVQVADQELSASTVKILFGVHDRPARTVLLQTRGTSVGIRLVQFRPSSRVTVRDGSLPIDVDSLKAIEFLVPDFERATAALAAGGYRLAAPPARYSTLEDGRFTEGRLQGPDGVSCSLLQMHDTPLSKYVSITDQTFSEVLGVSAPVSDRDAAVAFYRDTLGLRTVLSYEIAGESFQRLLDAREETLVRGIKFGAPERGPLIGVVHYGLPSAAFRSLRDRSVLPNRGLQGIRFSVPSVDVVARAASTAGMQIVAPPADAVLFPQGRVRSILLRAPQGVLHHFTETLKA